MCVQVVQVHITIYHIHLLQLLQRLIVIHIINIFNLRVAKGDGGWLRGIQVKVKKLLVRFIVK